MWWFWTLAIPILAGAACHGLLLVLGPSFPADDGARSRTAGRLLLTSAALFLAFVLYAAVRTAQAPVFMTAERSLLLFVLPALVWMQLRAPSSGSRPGLLFSMLQWDLLLLGLYGILNHVFFDSRLVMWVPGYEQYTSHHRATGSYFCPDHFAGIMEFGVALALGMLLSRDRSPRELTLSGALLAVALIAVAMSKSRGGGMSVLLVLAASLVFGFSQWRAYQRWCYRLSAAALLGIGIILFANHADQYMKRMREHKLVAAIAESSPRQWPQALREAFPDTDRGAMICGAMRAWGSARLLGIGPGMHQNLWPRFAATADGDRAAGIWPTRTNEGFHSYEVHSDWVQLLEEYGLAGFALFTSAAAFFYAALLAAHFSEAMARKRRTRAPGRPSRHHATLAALLSFTAMSFHSLGDFNLQMPATGWMLAAILAIPFARLPAAGQEEM